MGASPNNLDVCIDAGPRAFFVVFRFVDLHFHFTQIFSLSNVSYAGTTGCTLRHDGATVFEGIGLIRTTFVLRCRMDKLLICFSNNDVCLHCVGHCLTRLLSSVTRRFLPLIHRLTFVCMCVGMCSLMIFLLSSPLQRSCAHGVRLAIYEGRL